MGGICAQPAVRHDCDILAPVAHVHIIDRTDVLRGVLLAGWIAATDVGLKMMARVGGCDGEAVLDATTLSGIWQLPAACAGSEMAGPSIRLLPHLREGGLLGFGSGLTGFQGQVYGLGLLFVATLTTILVIRWKWRANGDPQALGAIWGGAIALGLPRLAGSGAGLAELEFFGMSAGVGDLALIWGVVWLGLRLVGELRA